VLPELREHNHLHTPYYTTTTTTTTVAAAATQPTSALLQNPPRLLLLLLLVVVVVVVVVSILPGALLLLLIFLLLLLLIFLLLLFPVAPDCPHLLETFHEVLHLGGGGDLRRNTTITTDHKSLLYISPISPIKVGHPRYVDPLAWPLVVGALLVIARSEEPSPRHSLNFWALSLLV
jgi:energy-coupling factor transporter transmembrane protein EcfT